tara:strand:+ start:1060 stop:1236 length:177 start_codon:yes stop_codon:yes gene_type:complete
MTENEYELGNYEAYRDILIKIIKGYEGKVLHNYVREQIKFYAEYVGKNDQNSQTLQSL